MPTPSKPPAEPAGPLRLFALRSLFEACGLKEIATTTIDATVGFTDFDDLWTSQTPSYSPTTKAIDAMAPGDRTRLIEAVRCALPIAADGTIRYSARANAIKARVAMRGSRAPGAHASDARLSPRHLA